MKIVDLSHTMNVHTPGWVGYAGNKMYYAQNLQTVRIVAQRIDTALHVGTHFDGAMHATDNRHGDKPESRARFGLAAFEQLAVTCPVDTPMRRQ